MILKHFFAQHPVFNRQEFINFLQKQNITNANTQREILAYHTKKANILKIRQGLYATVPDNIESAEQLSVDPFLIAGRIYDDTVLAYHSALDFHGVAYSIFYEFYFHSAYATKPFEFRNNVFKRIAFPKALLKKNKTMFSVNQIDRQGLDIKVTSLERTVTDILDRPDLSASYEEIWRSVEMIAVLDIDQLIQYTLLLDNASLTAKVGFFLEEHQEQFSVNKKHLSKLEKHIPISKHYMDQSKKNKSKLIKRWNLLVPIEILEKSWEEPSDII